MIVMAGTLLSFGLLVGTVASQLTPNEAGGKEEGKGTAARQRNAHALVTMAEEISLLRRQRDALARRLESLEGVEGGAPRELARAESDRKLDPDALTIGQLASLSGSLRLRSGNSFNSATELIGVSPELRRPSVDLSWSDPPVKEEEEGSHSPTPNTFCIDEIPERLCGKKKAASGVRVSAEGTSTSQALSSTARRKQKTVSSCTDAPDPSRRRKAVSSRSSKIRCDAELYEAEMVETGQGASSSCRPQKAGVRTRRRVKDGEDDRRARAGEPTHSGTATS